MTAETFAVVWRERTPGGIPRRYTTTNGMPARWAQQATVNAAGRAIGGLAPHVERAGRAVGAPRRRIERCRRPRIHRWSVDAKQRTRIKRLNAGALARLTLRGPTLVLWIGQTSALLQQHFLAEAP